MPPHTSYITRSTGVRWQSQESCRSRIVGHPSDGRSVGLADPQAARADNRTEPSNRSRQASSRPRRL
jgi:hypothetical protein